MARAYAALGQAGVDEITALSPHVAKDFGALPMSVSCRRILTTPRRRSPLGIPTNQVSYEVGTSAVAAPSVQLQCVGNVGGVLVQLVKT